MERKGLNRALVNGALFLLGATLSPLFGLLANKDVLNVVWLAASAMLALVFVGWREVIWARHGIRCRILTFSQRRSAHALVSLLAAIIVVLLAVLVPSRLGFHPPLFALIGGSPLLVPGIILALAGAIMALVMWADRMRVEGTHCYLILRRVDYQRDEGIFDFEELTTISAIRRTSRILDYLAARHEFGIERHAWAYQLSDLEPPPESAAGSDDMPARANGNPRAGGRAATSSPLASLGGLGPSPRSPHPPSATLPRRVDEQSAQMLSQHERDLATQGNKIWKEGARLRWRVRGTPARPLEVEPFAKRLFGNNLDHLFNQGKGFRVYEVGGPRFMTMVIKGPPGAGKSTLALQLGATLARQGNCCIYYSLEEEWESLLQTAHNFGWDQPDSSTDDPDRASQTGDHTPDAEDAQQTPPLYRGVLGRRGRSRLGRRISDLNAAGYRVGAVLVSSLGHRAMAIKTRMRQLHREWGDHPETVRCVVIDSLEGFANAGLEVEGQIAVPRGELLRVKDFFRDRCQLLVILVEDGGSETPGYVDFVADVVIQLGSRVDDDYTLLFAQVLKARNQSHALGQHQVKIRSIFDKRAIEDAAGVRTFGKIDMGLQIFPSLHFRLLQALIRPMFDSRILSSGLSGLDEMFSSDPARGGRPDADLPASPDTGSARGLRSQTACTLLGRHGTGKSLIGMNFLVEGVRENTPALLLSLRDDEGIVTSRRVPQGPGRMRFSWESLPTDGRVYHRLAWELDGIARPLPHLRAPRRLPYLFTLGPMPYDKLKTNDRMRTQAEATAIFLDTLAAACPPSERLGRWTTAARAHAFDVYQEAWGAFIGAMEGELVEDPDHPVQPKRIRLEYAREGKEDDPPPCLVWDSRTLHPTTHEVEPDTSLLKVIYWRPGYTTPEYFVDRLLQELDFDEAGRSRFERVVFDDVSQLEHRFPLLAKSRIFLPTLIDLFKSVGITSLFLGDSGNEAARELGHGLETMADHVIRTKIRDSRSLAVGTADPSSRSAPGSPPIHAHEIDPRHRAIVVEIEARPGAKLQAPHRLDVRPAAFARQTETAMLQEIVLVPLDLAPEKA